MRKVWCSPHRRKAIDIAKGVDVDELASGNGKEAEEVATGYKLGILLGVRGTPGIVMPEGRLLRNCLPADLLIGALGLKKQ